ncbi:MAG: glycoside hydrolase domain-containing protein [Minicystis sp.]
MDADEVSAKNRYVQSVTLNGADLHKPEIMHADLESGGTLRFVMGPKPSTWGQ